MWAGTSISPVLSRFLKHNRVYCVPPISKHDVPSNALLARYLKPGYYTDCYTLDFPGHVSLSEFVVAFYTTPLFKLERLILKWAVSRPSTDADASDIAEGRTTSFAAWTLEDRTDDELLMCDFQKRTRSWFMVSTSSEPNASTRLFFGSAVVPVHNSETGERSLGFVFRALLGFHKLYSRALLRSAARKLGK